MRSTTLVVLLLAAPLTANRSADPAEPKLTILAPASGVNSARADLKCIVRVEFGEDVKDAGIVLATFYTGRVMAGSVFLKPKRISDRVYEYEGMIRTPAEGKYILKMVRYDKNMKRQSSQDIKSRPGRRDSSELDIEVSR